MDYDDDVIVINDDDDDDDDDYKTKRFVIDDNDKKSCVSTYEPPSTTSQFSELQKLLTYDHQDRQQMFHSCQPKQLHESPDTSYSRKRKYNPIEWPWPDTSYSTKRKYDQVEDREPELLHYYNDKRLFSEDSSIRHKARCRLNSARWRLRKKQFTSNLELEIQNLLKKNEELKCEVQALTIAKNILQQAFNRLHAPCIMLQERSKMKDKDNMIYNVKEEK